MQFTTTLLTALSAITLTLAAPAAETRLDKRAGGLFFCNNINFDNSAGCALEHVPIGICQNMPNGFVDSVSSIGPDSDIICTLFDNSGCQTNQGQINNVVTPGFSDLRQISDSRGNWNDRIASYQCFRN